MRCMALGQKYCFKNPQKPKIEPQNYCIALYLQENLDLAWSLEFKLLQNFQEKREIAYHDGWVADILVVFGGFIVGNGGAEFPGIRHDLYHST